MALVYRAELSPSKLDLVGGWVSTRPWGRGTGSDLQRIAAYRFDDPDGEVGIEAHLVRTADGRLLHVPLTYRGAPAPGQEAHLVGTMEHSVLGRRWVYDACGDPVAVTAYLRAVVTGGTGAEEHVVTGDGFTPRATDAAVVGSGAPGVHVGPLDGLSVGDSDAATTVRTGPLTLVVHRVLQPTAAPGGPVLTGTWAGQASPVVLASVRPFS
ncbi:CG0192-related protein [Geodermatophilus maliterrae]|uniref:Maltokinase N-terminal cap domain-containing protein n=1 Tax=Geodermatophilus maliterrae TaxID=3162531 RepID=A0ABV3XPL2_9ACTN